MINIPSFLYSRIGRQHVRTAATLSTLLVASLAIGQNAYWVAQWDKSTGSDMATSNAVDQADNIVVTGNAWTVGHGNDIVTIKYAPDGTRLWVREFNGPGNGADVAKKVVVDGAGNIVVGGTTTSQWHGTDYVVIKYDPNGNLLWKRYFDGEGSQNDALAGLTLDKVGNVFVTGSSHGLDTWMDYATVKYSAAGQRKWVRIYRGLGGVLDDYATGITLDAFGYLVVTGYSDAGSDGDTDFATVRYSPTGVFQWARRIGGGAASADRAWGVVADGAGNSIVYGDLDNAGTSAGLDWLVVKYDAAGTELWHRNFNDPDNEDDIVHNMVVLPTNELVGVGTLNKAGGYGDICLIKLSPSGGFLWARLYDGPYHLSDWPYAAVADKDSNVVVTGYTMTSAPSGDCVTLKYDASGHRLWARRYGLSTRDEYGDAVALDSSLNPIVSGSGERSVGGYDYLTIKYKP